MSNWLPRWPLGRTDEPERLTTKEEVMAAAKEYGMIELTRYDKDLGKMVVDYITDQMPESEIVL